jgi:hypothetical protein
MSPGASPLLPLSVIIPLKTARTPDPLEGVRAWVEGQTCPRDRYEVLVAANGDHPAWEARARALLRPPDLLVRPEPRLGTFALLDAAAGVARGQWLYFAELHTVPDPTCVEELLSYLDRADVVAASVESGSRGATPLARGERRYFEEVNAIWRGVDRHPPLPLRGSVVRRDALEAVGGMPRDYGLFAGDILAAKLHAAGFKVGHARRARIVHVEQGSLRRHRWDVAFFTWGEMTYHATHDPDFCERYFGRSVEWAERNGYRPELARLRARGTRRALVSALTRRRVPGRARALGVLAAECLRHLARGRIGVRGEMVAAWLATGLAEARFALWGPEGRRGYRALHDVKRRYTRCVRLWCVGRHVRSALLPPPERRPSLDMAALREAELLGFHERETFEGALFRWTDVCAVLRLDIEPGDYTVRLVTNGVRRELERVPLAIFWNEHQVALSEIRVSPDAVCFPVERSAFVHGPDQRLTLVCPPLEVPRTSRETRRLGLPIFRVDLQARA